MTLDSKKALYEAQWAARNTSLIRHFPRKFTYAADSLLATPPRTVLDLGGGTGIYTQALMTMGYETTLLDFSEAAIMKARAAHIPQTICADFMQHDFGDMRYDVILAKGFSPLNTDDDGAFDAILTKARRLLTQQGVVLYWVYSTLEERWSESGWFEVGFERLSLHFDAVQVLPWFNLQTRLPWQVNLLASHLVLGRLQYGRRVAVLGAARAL